MALPLCFKSLTLELNLHSYKIKAHQTGGLCKQRWQPPFNTVELVCKEAKNTYLLFVRTTKRQESVWSGIEQWITSVLDGGHHNAAVPFVEQSIQMRSLRGNGVDRNIKRDRFPSWPGTCNIPYPLSLHMAAETTLKALSFSRLNFPETVTENH